MAAMASIVARSEGVIGWTRISGGVRRDGGYRKAEEASLREASLRE
jgi:hypothetical protein